MKLAKVRTLMSLGLFLSLVWAGTFALWTDDAQSDASFSTGNVAISASPASVDFNAAAMAPGDVVYGGIDITNSGSLELRYDMSTSATNQPGLADALQAEIKKVTGACDAASWIASSTVMGGSSSLGSLAISTARTLGPGASETACFRVELPVTDTGSSSKSTVATFTFSAEQTANN